jgi:hypothetical protein
MNKYILGALLIGALLCTAPAMAQTEIFITTPAGGIAPQFSMTLPATEISYPLVVGENLKDGNLLTIETNSAYTVKIKDMMIAGKPVGTEGKLVSMLTGVGTFSGTGLTNKLNMAIGAGSYTALSGVDQIIRSGTAELYSAPLKLKQTVVVTDPVLPSTNQYQIKIQVTGSATP